MGSFFSKLFGSTQQPDFKALVAQGAVIVDVRSQGEFQSGHLRGSQNIPLDHIQGKAAELKKKNKPIITVCMSGSRSRMAEGILRRAGVEAYNGGPWFRLESRLS